MPTTTAFPTKLLLASLSLSLSAFCSFCFAASGGNTKAPDQIHSQVIEAEAIKTKNMNTRVINTQLLSPTVGNEDKEAGARVESVEQMEDGKTVKISVSLPNQKGSNIEEVIVVGRPTKQKAESPTLEQKQKFEVVNNLEEGRSGVVIYLGKQEDFLLKLNYTEPRPDVEPDVFNRK